MPRRAAYSTFLSLWYINCNTTLSLIQVSKTISAVNNTMSQMAVTRTISSITFSMPSKFDEQTKMNKIYKPVSFAFKSKKLLPLFTVELPWKFFTGLYRTHFFFYFFPISFGIDDMENWWSETQRQTCHGPDFWRRL